MRKFLLSLCLLALPLAACTTVPTTLPTPSTVSNKTVLDEQAGITVNLAYKAWRVLVEAGVKSGQIKGQLAGRIADIDNQLYSAVQAVDAAYAAGNSADYAAAITHFNDVLARGHAALGVK